MLVANASSFNRTGKQITDLRTAVTRIGHSMVRRSVICLPCLSCAAARSSTSCRRA
jgi:HD-like signal output (HDOD) protein